MKKLFCLLLVTMLFCMSVCAAEILKSGTCGDNLTWKIDTDEVLTISGTGEMYDYPVRDGLECMLTDAPWFRYTYTSVVVEEGVTSIGDCAFYPYYSSVTRASFPSTLKRIGASAFYYADIEEITIPEGVTEIGNYAFESCHKLKFVQISSTVSSIGENSFKDCTSLLQITVNTQNGFYTSENGVLLNKNKTYLIQYPIGSTASQYNIPESVTKIGASAFYNASPKLTRVDIGEGVTNVKDNSFKNSYVTLYCKNGSDAYYHALVNNVLFMCTDSGWTPEVVYSAPCGDNAVWTLYENFVLEITGTGPTDDWKDGSSYSSTSIATPWYPFKNSILKLKVGEGITSLGSCAFCYCSSMRFAELPSSLRTIGDLAFDSCGRLCKADIPSGVTSIGEYAFRYTDIIRVVIPAGVRTIGTQTFLSCDKLESVTFAENSLIRTLGQQAFGSCTSLKEFTIPASVGNVGLYQFDGCENLEKLTVLSRTVGVSSCTPDQFPLLTVYCYENSTAHTTAQSKGISYILIDGSGYTVAYDANGGNGAPAAQTQSYGSNLTITSSVPTKTGYVFKGWSASKNGSVAYMPGDTYTAGKSVTLYAVWETEKYDVIYDANGGTGAPAPQKKIYAVTLKLSDVKPVRENYTFKGWAMTPTGSAVYYSGSNYAVNAPVTLYAVWEAVAYYGDLTWNISVSGVLTISGNGAMPDAASADEVPWYEKRASVKRVVIGNGVTKIGKYAFRDCANLTSVSIADSVTSIGFAAFYNCSALESISISDSVTAVVSSAFERCTALKEINVDDANTNYTSVSGVLFNKNKTTLIQYPVGSTAVSYSVPSGVTRINYAAFYLAANLENVTLPDGVTAISSSAFSGCRALESVNIPESVTTIGGSAFKDCESLESVTIPSGVKTIGSSAFTGYDGFTVYGYSDTEAQTYAQSNNLNFVNLYAVLSGKCGDALTWELDNSLTLTVSGTGEMYDITSPSEAPWYSVAETIESVVISDGVTGIGDYAFKNCTALENISIADSVVRVGRKAFHNTAYYNNEDIWVENNYALYVDGCLVAFNSSPDCGAYYCGVKDGTRVIADYTFDSNLYSVKIPASVVAIGKEAFGECFSLSTVTFSEGSKLKTIGDGAFRGCHELERFDIPTGVTYIGSYAFSSCLSFTEIIIPDTVKSLGSYAFSGCFLAKSVAIPDGITAIGEGTFNGCDALSEITIPDSITSIGDCAFSYCSCITDVYYDGSRAEWSNIDIGSYNEYLTEAQIHFADIPETYKVTYDANGGSSAPEEQFKNHNEVMLITSTVPEREGYEFKGWSAEPGGQVAYRPGNAYTDNADITLYAVWEKKEAGKLVYGDISGDESVNVSDVIYMLQFIASGDSEALDETQTTAADVNCDGSIDVSDAIRILQYLASPENTVLGPRGMLGFLRKQGEASAAVNPVWLEPIE